MAKGIGAAMAGGNPKEGRNEFDYYPTPEECTIALLGKEREFLNSAVDTIWEPACGCGEMMEVIKRESGDGFRYQSSDLIPRGYGEEQDFITTSGKYASTAIITNPPFNLASKFIEQALGELEVPYLALLLKATFWHAKTRLPLFNRFTPAVIYPMTWRPDSMKRGAPTMDCSWIVWDRSRTGTQYIPLEKPQIVS